MKTPEDPPIPSVMVNDKVPAKFVIGCSDEDFEDPQEEEEFNVVPPDGGWGWVVVAASFMCNAIVDGIIFTSGMLFPNLKETYGASNAEVAWIASLLGGFYLIVGPFVSGLANAFGFRAVCILGSLIGASACFISYFATSIVYLYFSFGILGGMGFGLIYVPAVIATGFYFEKRRALATGIAVCGSGIGTFIMSPVNTYLLTSFGERWNIIFLVYGGIILLCAFFGLAFRPLSAATGKRQKPETPLLLRIKRARDLDLANCPSALSMSSATSRSPSKLTLEDGTIFAHDLKPNAGNALVARTLLERHGGPPLTLSKRSSYPGITLNGPEPILEEDDETGSVHPTKQSNGVAKTVANGDCLLDDNKNETNATINAKLLENLDPVVSKVKYPRIESAPLLSANSIAGDLKNRRASRVSLRLDRPFYRDDIFYSGSMARLPQYQSSETVGQYHASVTHFPDNDDAGDDENCKCCPTSLKNVLVRMFDLSLLSSITFIFLSVSGFLALMSLFVPFNFLPSYATDLGIDPGDASFIMSLIGICNTVGRIVAGWVSDHPKVDALMVNNLALIIGGGATVALPFLQNLSLLYLYATVFGLCVAAFASLRSILLVELLGLEKLTNAFGLLLLFQGFAATFGSPIAGAFVDYTKEYNLSFYVFGSIFALSGLLCIPLRRIKNWEENRIDEKLRKAKYGPSCT